MWPSPSRSSRRCTAPDRRRPAGRGRPRRWLDSILSQQPMAGARLWKESVLAELEIGIGKSGRRAYGLDDIAIVPSRRTRDPEAVDTSWEIDAFRSGLPLMGAPMDSVMSPATAIELGRLGGVGVLNLEGL